MAKTFINRARFFSLCKTVYENHDCQKKRLSIQDQIKFLRPKNKRAEMHSLKEP